MESLSHGLTTGFPEPKTIIALRRSQAHLVWFLPYVILRLALTAWRYDVVHLGDALLSAAGFLPRKLWRRKVAVSVHGLDLTFRPRVYQAYLKVFLRADVFIANSDSTSRILASRGFGASRTIPIGVAERHFSAPRRPDLDAELVRRAAGRVVLVTVGRLVRRKGAAWFVRHVLPKLDSVLYVVIGVGQDHDEIERAAAETHTADALWLVGGVSDARLLALLGAADVFVMPNIAVPGDVEGFGIVAVEAAASGLPVIASDLEGIPDAISDGANGMLLLSGDAEAFVAALRPLLDNADERRERGARARAYTQAHSSWPQIIAQYRQTFASLLEDQALAAKQI